MHQVARILGRRPLRLHLIEPRVDGAALLDNYVLDACIMQRPQVASLDPQRFCVIELLSSPLYLVSNGSHALSYEKGITAADLASQTELYIMAARLSFDLSCLASRHSGENRLQLLRQRTIPKPMAMVGSTRWSRLAIGFKGWDGGRNCSCPQDIEFGDGVSIARCSSPIAPPSVLCRRLGT